MPPLTDIVFSVDELDSSRRVLVLASELAGTGVTLDGPRGFDFTLTAGVITSDFPPGSGVGYAVTEGGSDGSLTPADLDGQIVNTLKTVDYGVPGVIPNSLVLILTADLNQDYFKSLTINGVGTFNSADATSYFTGGGSTSWLWDQFGLTLLVNTNVYAVSFLLPMP